MSRQDLILKFMLALVESEYYASQLGEEWGRELERTTEKIYLLAAILADRHINGV